MKLTVTITKDDVVNKYKEIITKYVKNASIPGFRKGHVPANLLESKFGKALDEEAVNSLIEESISSILDDKLLTDEFRPLGYMGPHLTEKPNFNKDADFTYSVIYDVRPKVAIGDIKGLEVKIPDIQVADDDLARELMIIQERNSTIQTKNDGEPIEKGDIVKLDTVELENEAEKADTERKDFTLTLDEKESFYKFDDDLIGLKKDETKIITKTYEDSFFADLKGKTVTWRVKINEIKKRILPPVDDELAQDVDEAYKTVDDLKKSLMSDLQKRCDKRLETEKKTALMKAIIEKYDFELPLSMINAQVNYRLQEIAEQFRIDVKDVGRVFAMLGKDPKEAVDELIKNATNALKDRFVLDALTSERGIKVSDEELDAKFAEIATEQGISKEEVKKQFEGSGDTDALEELKIDMCDEKVYKMLYDEMKITKDRKMSLGQMMEEDKKRSVL